MFTLPNDVIVLNLPEQVEKNKTDIATNKANIETLQEGTTATAIVDKLKGQSLNVDSITLSDLTSNGSLNVIDVDANTLTLANTLDVEGKATFGGDAEVDGNLILNSADNVVDKDGNKLIQSSALSDFEKEYYSCAFKYKMASVTYSLYEFGDRFIRLSDEFPGITKATDMTGFAQYFTVSGSNFTVIMQKPATTCKLHYTFFYSKGITRVEFTGGTFTNLYGSSTESSDITEFVGTTTTYFSGGIEALFNYSTKLTTISGFDMSGVTSLANTFSGCTSLKTLDCTGIHVSFNISSSTKFEESDLVTIINNLETVSTAQTLTMGSTNLAKLTQDEILVATGKGWTLA